LGNDLGKSGFLPRIVRGKRIKKEGKRFHESGWPIGKSEAIGRKVHATGKGRGRTSAKLTRRTEKREEGQRRDDGGAINFVRGEMAKRTRRKRWKKPFRVCEYGRNWE